ncbi:uncharacterized protein LOC112560276 [Pomacea canaliculata]|uniref:uncharacterized protein LOC112560276 n=1 Tax=Pomacea canaliculata TaxID=400727 RepID=UPI000D734E23|nr:uncharacterized protein LOC112560276 [Pomacea canaliculata]
MKLLTLLILVATGVTRSQARTCADLRDCVSERSKMSEDKHEESCRILANIRDCVHEAFADCRRNSSLPQAVEDQINLFLTEAEKKCGSGTASHTVSIFLLLLPCSILLLF